MYLHSKWFAIWIILQLDPNHLSDLVVVQTDPPGMVMTLFPWPGVPFLTFSVPGKLGIFTYVYNKSCGDVLFIAIPARSAVGVLWKPLAIKPLGSRAMQNHTRTPYGVLPGSEEVNTRILPSSSTKWLPYQTWIKLFPSRVSGRGYGIGPVCVCVCVCVCVSVSALPAEALTIFWARILTKRARRGRARQCSGVFISTWQQSVQCGAMWPLTDFL